MKRIPNKFLKLALLTLAVTAMSGCVAGRPLNAYDRAALLGAAENQALKNAHDAAWGQGVYRHQEHRDRAPNDYRHHDHGHHHDHHRGW